MIHELRQQVKGEIFDYQVLKNVLSGYAAPRDHVTVLLKRGDVIRVKERVVHLWDKWRRRPCQRELLANLIYGPYIGIRYCFQIYKILVFKILQISKKVLT